MKVTDLLRTMDMFENLSAEDLDRVAHSLRERRLNAGEELFHESSVGDAMFIVTGGRIKMTTGGANGSQRTLAYFSDGQFFGEMALLTGGLRSGTAVAETPSRVLVLQKQEFEALLATNAELVRELLKILSQRTVQTNQQLLTDDGAANSASVGSGQVFAIFSPRGGAGKTTLAVNLAMILAHSNPERVSLVDLDLTFGRASLLLGLEPETSLAAVPPESLDVLDRRTMSQYMVTHSAGLQLLPGSTRPEEGETVTGAHVRAALGALKRQFTTTIVDCPGTFNDPTMTALEIADRVLVVCTPELNCLHDVRECQRIFGELLHIERAKVYYVLNYYQPFKLLSREQLQATLEESVTAEVPYAGEMAMRAAMKGEPLVMLNPGSAFARAVLKISTDLVPADDGLARTWPARSRKPRPVATGDPKGSAPSKPRGLFGALRRAWS